MKAWTIVKYGKPEAAFQLLDHEKPVRKQGEVLIEVEAFGLNYADIMARNGLYREAPKPPFVPGYEVVGKVVECDEKSDLLNKRVIAFTRFGAYAEYVTTAERGIQLIDEKMPAGEAVALATQYVTAYHAAYEAVNLFNGDRIMVHAAAGGVGIAITQLAKLKGCEVFGTASSDEKLNFLKQNGVDHPINYKTHDYELEILKIIGDDRLDVAFNSIGGSTFKKDRNLVGTAGRQVLYGGAERSGKKFGIFSTLNFVRKMGLVIPIGLMMKSKGIIGVNMLKVADYKPHIISRCMAELLKLYNAGKIKPYVGGDFSSDELAKAHHLLESRQSIGKIVVKWR